MLNLFTKRSVATVVLAAGLVYGGAGWARDVVLDGRTVLTVGDDLAVHAPDPSAVAAHAADGSHLAFVASDGRVYAADLDRDDRGAVTVTAPSLILDLSLKLGRATATRFPLLGFMPPDLATEDVAAGDLIIGLNDQGIKSLVTTVKRSALEDDLFCARAMGAAL